MPNFAPRQRKTGTSVSSAWRLAEIFDVLKKPSSRQPRRCAFPWQFFLQQQLLTHYVSTIGWSIGVIVLLVGAGSSPTASWDGRIWSVSPAWGEIPVALAFMALGKG